MKPEIILDDYCEECPHFSADSNSIFEKGKAVITVIQCVYRDQCRYAVNKKMKLLKKKREATGDDER